MEYIPLVSTILLSFSIGFCLGRAHKYKAAIHEVYHLQEQLDHLKESNKITNDLYDKERHLKEKYQDLYYSLSENK
jgi:hypothetical protein